MENKAAELIYIDESLTVCAITVANDGDDGSEGRAFRDARRLQYALERNGTEEWMSHFPRAVTAHHNPDAARTFYVYQRYHQPVHSWAEHVHARAILGIPVSLAQLHAWVRTLVMIADRVRWCLGRCHGSLEPTHTIDIAQSSGQLQLRHLGTGESPQPLYYQAPEQWFGSGGGDTGLFATFNDQRDMWAIGMLLVFACCGTESQQQHPILAVLDREPAIRRQHAALYEGGGDEDEQLVDWFLAVVYFMRALGNGLVPGSIVDLRLVAVRWEWWAHRPLVKGLVATAPLEQDPPAMQALVARLRARLGKEGMQFLRAALSWTPEQRKGAPLLWDVAPERHSDTLAPLSTTTLRVEDLVVQSSPHASGRSVAMWWARGQPHCPHCHLNEARGTNAANPLPCHPLCPPMK